MEDNYFDKKLKGILTTPPDLQPDDSAILDMKKRLSNNRPNKKRIGLLWLVPMILLPLFLGAGFFYSKYQKLSNQVIDLTQQVTQIKEIHFRDTILEKQIIHHYDTIINVIYKERYVKDTENRNQVNPYFSNYLKSSFSDPNYTNLVSSRNSIYSNWGPGDKRNSLLTYPPGSSIFNHIPSSIGLSKEKEIEEVKFTDVKTINALGPLFLDTPINEPDWVEKLSDQIPEYSIGETKTAYYFIPNGFSIGASTSLIAIPVNAFGSQGKIYGITGALELPGNRSLQIGLEWLSTNFEIKDDDILLSPFPIEAPEDPSDNLHELKGNFNYLQIPVTIRQKFFNSKKINPFVNIGFTAYKPLNQKFIYEYINGTGEYKLNRTFKNGAFSADNLRLGIGAEYAINGSLSATSEVQYQHAFSQGIGEYYKLRHWSFNLGLRYQLAGN